jgi:hypothetical protein
MTETHNSDLDKENKKTNSNHSSLSLTLSLSKSYGKLGLMPEVKQRKIQQWIFIENYAHVL